MVSIETQSCFAYGHSHKKAFLDAVDAWQKPFHFLLPVLPKRSLDEAILLNIVKRADKVLRRSLGSDGRRRQHSNIKDAWTKRNPTLLSKENAFFDAPLNAPDVPHAPDIKKSPDDITCFLHLRVQSGMEINR
ncbi:hypothetical protein DPMN_094317 [Dreissena polymorpha]|uniref:Uncharacterized protein n=1 Tax=Dreissena polymorpha TaxID=45954 RepID=A0A9D4L5J1_DREPO|nr:hypothetical protein DPMN_094317 [Dreissena polymorpha]